MPAASRGSDMEAITGQSSDLGERKRNQENPQASEDAEAGQL